MSATYWVLISDELFASRDTIWPPGMRPVLPLDLREPARDTPSWELPAMHWQQFTDDGADQELEGRKVSVVVRAEGGVPYISERRIIE
jgi:hypothetical protein